MKPFYGLIFTLALLSSQPLQAALVIYNIDPTQSTLTFSGTVLVPNPLGAGTLTLQIVDQHLLRPSGDLTTRLGGSFTADPVLLTLGTGAPISQLDALQGRLFSGVTPVGQISIPLGSKLDFVLSNSGLLAINGGVNYSTVAPFNVSGNFSLGGANLNLGAPVFNGSSSVSVPVSFSGLIPTGNNNFVVNGTFSGQIVGIAAVPEPSSMLLLSSIGLLGGWRSRRQLLRFKRKIVVAIRSANEAKNAAIAVRKATPIDCSMLGPSGGCADPMRRSSVSKAPVRISNRLAITLVEVLTVLMIVSILLGLLLPAIHSARQSARRNVCLMNLHQIGLALHAFHGAKLTFPHGRDTTSGRHHSWATEILPYIDQGALHEAFDLKLPWDDKSNSKNFELANTRISLFQCPESSHDEPGTGDYGGNYGTRLTGLPVGFGLGQSWSSGVLLAVDRIKPGVKRVSLSDIRDGSSSTILVAEDAGLEGRAGMWANGNHCLAADSPGINLNRSQEIYSDHPGGAHVLFCDGAARFLSTKINSKTLGGLCTRAQREMVKEEDYLP